ncbi:MAG: efflux RND transporter periplasmic adaptor subunit [Desulfobacterales bacterium]|nr:efflux RND transporter periplasmic adaptor subunit [Desulfobacterales bacterium]
MFRFQLEHGLTYRITCFLLSQFLILLSAAYCWAETYDTFLEPNQIVDISSPFRGRISSIHVRNGDQITAGQLLAELDTHVLDANLASAEVAASFRGRIDAARALATMRKNRYAMLQELEKSGNARPEEMKRAETDLAMAQAQLQSALDDKKLKKLEADIIRAQIDEKKLRSPIDGIVVKIHKQQAELIGGNDQQAFMTIVQLDPLKAVFHLPQDVMGGMQAGEQISIDAGNKRVTGKIDFVSPVINAQSGTIEVSIIIPNSDKSLTSGSRCTLTAP